MSTDNSKTPKYNRRQWLKGSGTVLGVSLLPISVAEAAAAEQATAAKVENAKIEDFQFRDFRHCARTRWADAGLPFEVGEVGIGHKIRGIAGRYINLSDNQIRGVFQEMFARSLQRNPEHAVGCQESNVSV